MERRDSGLRRSKEVLLGLCLEERIRFESQGGPEHRSMRPAGRRVDMWLGWSEEALEQGCNNLNESHLVQTVPPLLTVRERIHGHGQYTEDPEFYKEKHTHFQQRDLSRMLKYIFKQLWMHLSFLPIGFTSKSLS